MFALRTTRTPTRRHALGELLVQAGTVDARDLDVALDCARREGRPLGQILVELGLLSEAELTHALSRHLKVPTWDWEPGRVAPDVTRWIDAQTAERFRVFPVSADPARALLKVATSDPTNVEALQTLTARSGMMVFFLISEERTILEAIRRHYGERPSPTSAPVPAPVDAFAEIQAALREQSMAIRGMLAALDEKGVLTRSDVFSRFSFNKRPPPLPLRPTRTRRFFSLLGD